MPLTTLKNFAEYARAALPDGLDLSKVDLWFQDESRVGQQGSTTRQWTIKGTRPRAIQQCQFTYAYIYGAVCPSSGEAVGLVLPSVNGEAMKLHLQAISDAVPEGRHALLIVDGAAWHSKNYELSNITLLKLPPYSPELNPVEQVWQWLKQRFLSNRCFEDYQSIVDAWNEFRSDRGRVHQMCSRLWAKL